MSCFFPPTRYLVPLERPVFFLATQGYRYQFNSLVPLFLRCRFARNRVSSHHKQKVGKVPWKPPPPPPCNPPLQRDLSFVEGILSLRLDHPLSFAGAGRKLSPVEGSLLFSFFTDRQFLCICSRAIIPPHMEAIMTVLPFPLFLRDLCGRLDLMR